jgi:hypothetical protein
MIGPAHYYIRLRGHNPSIVITVEPTYRKRVSHIGVQLLCWALLESSSKPHLSIDVSSLGAVYVYALIDRDRPQYAREDPDFRVSSIAFIPYRHTPGEAYGGENNCKSIWWSRPEYFRYLGVSCGVLADDYLHSKLYPTREHMPQ